MANKFDKRGVRPVWEIIFDQLSWASGESSEQTDTTGSGTNGIIRQLVVTLNDNTGNVTATVAIKDSSGNTLHSKSCSEATTTVDYPITVANGGDHALVVNGFTLSVTPSGDPGASGLTVDVIARGV